MAEAMESLGTLKAQMEAQAEVLKAQAEERRTDKAELEALKARVAELEAASSTNAEQRELQGEPAAAVSAAVGAAAGRRASRLAHGLSDQKLARTVRLRAFLESVAISWLDCAS